MQSTTDIARIIYPIEEWLVERQTQLLNALDKRFSTAVYLMYSDTRAQITETLKQRWAMGYHHTKYSKVVEEVRLHGGRRSAWDRRKHAVRAWAERRKQRLKPKRIYEFVDESVSAGTAAPSNR